MRRVLSRRKRKSTAAYKKAATKAQKPTLATPVAKRERMSDFYVVGLGASAGGLEALRSLFAAVPAKTRAAFLGHQPPRPPSRRQCGRVPPNPSRRPVSH